MNPDLTLKIYQEIKDVREIRGSRTLDMAIWIHLVHRNATNVMFSSHFSWDTGCVCSPIFRHSPLLHFCYKYLQIRKP